MKIGIVSATPFEIEPATRFIQEQGASPHEVVVLVTGVGMLQATFLLTEQLRQYSFDYLLQAGIGGCLSEQFALADVVLVQEEVIGDLGVQEEEFKDLFDMGFAQPDQSPYTGKSLVNPYIRDWERFRLPFVKGVTVNEITTRPERIATLRQKYAGEVESMEGAAFHYVCLQRGIPFLQIRSLSNYAGERNKTNWKIREAITSLNKQLIRIIQHLTQS